MTENSKDIQLQYQGFNKTPLLWENDAIFQLNQFKITSENDLQYCSLSTPEIRLGKRVEQFCFFKFQQDPQIEILLENLQIQDKKRTVGEIDCILKKNNQPIHVELIYKFYLYDSTVGNSEIEHWIGPNRRDSLFLKLTKLKNKQLPLLNNSFTKPYLKTLQIPIEKIQQSVFFKAQLFVPLEDLKKNFPIINNDCIYGFYIRYNKLHQFDNCKFYIPTKVNWLKEIQTNIKWLTYSKFHSKIMEFVNQKSAPLCWVKFPNGTFQKFFVIWWE